MEEYRITRIYADQDGESHFEDIHLPLHDGGPIGFLSEAQQVGTIIFRKVIEQYDYDFHNAPARQYIALMDGEIEIETSLGAIRRFKPGDVLLVEDVRGKGHRSRNIRQEVRSSIFITLPEEQQ
jgi:hypothetical protein